MESITIFISVIFMVFGILQIILFFKLWEMTNDVKLLRNHFVSQAEANTPLQKSDSPSKPIPGIINNNGITYIINGKNVEYSDGIKGTLKIYPGYPECGVITDDGFELLYTNVYYACEDLHQYLTEKTESSNGLYEKRQNK